MNDRTKGLPGNRGGGVQSIERATALLHAVAVAGPEGATAAELGQAVGLHSSTAFHLIKTLESLELLNRRADSKRYRIGSRVFQLAAGAMNETALVNLGTPVLEQLSRETGEAAHLAVRSADQILLVARSSAAGMLQMSERAGIIRPAHATAIGKILLAYAGSDEKALLSGLDYERFTENTLRDSTILTSELEKVRNEGLAHDRAEFDADVRCIAAPVRDFTGRCIAAIGQSWPIWRTDDTTVLERGQIIIAAAQKLSTMLGGNNSCINA